MKFNLVDFIVLDSKEAPEDRKVCLFCSGAVDSPSDRVHYLLNGTIASTAELFEEKTEGGFYPVCNKCKNQIPQKFIFKFN